MTFRRLIRLVAPSRRATRQNSEKDGIGSIVIIRTIVNACPALPSSALSQHYTVEDYRDLIMDRKVGSAMTRRTACRMLIVILVTLVTVQAGRGPPDASSTLLKMHRLYMMQPPHDASLYTVLRVSPNATVAEITKSFRKLTRELHPDKAEHSRMSEKEREQRLQQVRQAYEVLKDDATTTSLSSVRLA